MKNIAFIPCEDVRAEAGGKVSLMGVFEGLVVDASTIKVWPATLRVAAQLRFELEKSEPSPNEVTFSLAFNGKEAVSAAAPIVIGRPDITAAVSVPMMLMPVDGPGAIVYSFTFRKRGEHEWAPLVFRVPVEVTNATPPAT